MIRTLHLAWLPVVAAVVIAACGGNSTTGPSGTDAAPVSGDSGCVTSVSGLPATVGTSETRTSFTISAGSGCAWTARPDVIWADIAPSSGSGSQSLTLTITENRSADSRTATVLVNNQRHQVRQSGVNNTPAPCTYTVSVTSLDAADGGETAGVTVTTPSGCPWTASSSESWITVSPSSGTATTVVEVRIAQNFGGARNAFVTIAGHRIDVKQAAR